MIHNVAVQCKDEKTFPQTIGHYTLICMRDEGKRFMLSGRKRTCFPSDLLQRVSSFRRFMYLSESWGHKKTGSEKEKVKKKKKDGQGRWLLTQ